MNWNDLPLKPSPKMLRQFAMAWLVLFPALGLFEWLARGRVAAGVTLALLGVVGGIAGWGRPAVLRPVFVAWMVLAFPVGWCVSQVVLGLLFYCVLTPVGFVMRMAGRDVLGRKAPARVGTLWYERGEAPEARRYFRQY
jgi:hypothetical protein